MKETLKVFTVNRRHVRQESLAKRDASQSRKPLGSKPEVRTLVRLRDGVALSVLGRGVRVKDVEI